MTRIVSFTSARTEGVRADVIKEGDRIMDPKGTLGILTVFAVEPLGGSIWLHATARRRVLRNVRPYDYVLRCIPSDR